MEDKQRVERKVNDLYYDLVTDFYEYGWGRSFHFAPRLPGESFKASLVRHEHHIADAIGLGPGMVAADIGCGVGGSLLEIARFSGARIVGVNSNAYQLERARRYAADVGLAHLADFLHCDFLHVDAPDESFDAVYSIEATCCAPDKVGIYSEIFRLLKPGSCFAAYEYCMTDRFNAQDPHHLKLKADMQLGGGLLEIVAPQTIDDALRAVGFEVLATRDMAVAERAVGPLVSTACRLGILAGELPQFTGWTEGHRQLAASVREGPRRAQRVAPRGADLEPLRRRDGRSGPAGHLHADVLHPRPQTGVGRNDR